MILYDEPAHEYHANPAIGSSKLRDFIRSPVLFRDRMDGFQLKETDALLFGTATHLALLEPDRYAMTVVTRPEGVDFRTKEGKEWREAQRGKLILSAEEGMHLAEMHKRMPAEVRGIFAACRKEVTVRVDLDGLMAQCRFDLFGGVNFDLKSIDQIENIDRSILKRGYHIQQRWYQRCEKAETGTASPFKFLFVEKQPPYRWRIVTLDAEYLMMADGAIDLALDGIQERMVSNDWTDPGELHYHASPPAWANDQEDDD